jgi:hypothetical protein
MFKQRTLRPLEYNEDDDEGIGTGFLVAIGLLVGAGILFCLEVFSKIKEIFQSR